jgi:hypothetical protein
MHLLVKRILTSCTAFKNFVKAWLKYFAHRYYIHRAQFYCPKFLILNIGINKKTVTTETPYLFECFVTTDIKESGSLKNKIGIANIT